MRGYLAVGHGIEPNKVFDPGAVAYTLDGRQITREYDLAFRVVASAAERLHSAGHDFDTESAGGSGHDPDYRGSVQRVNAGGYDWALEIHFDWARAPRGGSGLYVSPAGLDWANKIAFFGGLQHGLAFRGNVHRPDLWFLRGTRPPALIWECDRVGGDITTAALYQYAEAIATGTHFWLDRRAKAAA